MTTCSAQFRELNIYFLFSGSNVPLDCASGRGTPNIGLSLQTTTTDTSAIAAADKMGVDVRWHIPMQLSRFTPLKTWSLVAVG